MKRAILCGVMLLAASAARAGSYDACYNPRDARLEAGTITVAAPIFPAGTIPLQFSAINCDLVTAPVLGTLFITGTVVSGLRYAGVDDTAIVTMEWRISGGDKLVIAGVTKRGAARSYDLPVIGGAGLVAGSLASLTNLDPAGTAFEVDF